MSVGLITEYLMEAFLLIYGPFSAVDFDIDGLYSGVFALRNRDQIHSLVVADSWREDLLRHLPLAGPTRTRSAVRSAMTWCSWTLSRASCSGSAASYRPWASPTASTGFPSAAIPVQEPYFPFRYC